MDSDEYECMLFRNSTAESFVDDAWSNGSEDDTLFDLFEEEDVMLESQYGAVQLQTSDNGYSNTQPNTNNDERNCTKSIIGRVEAMLENIVEGLCEERESLTITLKSRASFSRRHTKALVDDGKLPEPKERQINFPGSNAQEAWSFTVLLRILEIIHSGLIQDTIMTKRDIYYRHPDLFVKQTVVDRYVDDLACTMGINRFRLNVVAAAKGLVAGNFHLIRENGLQVSGRETKEGILVPNIGDGNNDIIDLSSVQWVCVIEKEATFQSLLSTASWDDLRLHGVVLTAKGYPDVASRKFLRRLADYGAKIPMYALVDFDPDGIAILSTYKYGSYRLAHEGFESKDTSTFGLPAIRWLGVKSYHVVKTLFDRHGRDGEEMANVQGLMKLTARDRIKAIRMLEWDICTEDGSEGDWRHELQLMLMLNIKAEMQMLDSLSDGLVLWLRSELDRYKAQEDGLPINDTCLEDGLLFEGVDMCNDG